MRISLITVCFNSAATIRDTIESVVAQSYDDIQYIIIDGGSTDGTLDIIDEYKSNISIVLSEQDSGIYDAMNKGVRLATGEVVGILNSDDVFNGVDILETVVDVFSHAPDVDLLMGHVVFLHKRDRSKISRFYSSKRFAPWMLRFGWMPPHPATFVRTEVYRRHGIYKDKFRISSDYEIFVRWLYVHKLKYVKLDRILVRMLPGGASNTSLKSLWTLNREIVIACRENGLYTNLMFLVLKIPFKFSEKFRRP